MRSAVNEAVATFKGQWPTRAGAGCRASDQLLHPRLVVEAISLQAHSQCPRRAREANRPRTRRRRAETERGREGTRYIPAENRGSRTERDEVLREAGDDAAAEHRRLPDEARKAADDLRHKRQEALRREQENLRDELAHRTRREVFAIARKTLADLAGTTLQARMTDALVRRLRELGEEEKAELADALKSSGEPALVRAAFELPSNQQAEIQHALNETFSAEIQLRFAMAPDRIGPSSVVLSTAARSSLTAQSREVGPT